jgi:dTDP-4-dehydrorhamnose reductase
VIALICGANGQLGRALLRSAPRNVALAPVDRVHMDITDPVSVEINMARHSPDIVVNAAAFTNVEGAERDRTNAERVNSEGPRNLAIASKRASARLIHISSDFVFGGTSSLPYEPENQTNPLNVYGITKRDGERAVLEVLADRSVILRTSWLYAAEGNNFVTRMLGLMRARGRVSVVADQIGVPTSAVSVAATIWKIAQVPKLTGIHHWTDAGVASWYDFAVAIAEEAFELGLLSREVEVFPIATHQYPTPTRRPAYSVLSTKSLESLGIEAVHWRKQLRNVLRGIEAQKRAEAISAPSLPLRDGPTC